jgi:hypothetical protein
MNLRAAPEGVSSWERRRPRRPGGGRRSRRDAGAPGRNALRFHSAISLGHRERGHPLLPPPSWVYCGGHRGPHAPGSGAAPPEDPPWHARGHALAAAPTLFAAPRRGQLGQEPAPALRAAALDRAAGLARPAPRQKTPMAPHCHKAARRGEPIRAPRSAPLGTVAYPWSACAWCAVRSAGPGTCPCLAAAYHSGCRRQRAPAASARGGPIGSGFAIDD